jgi:hypothetical protein
VQEALGDAHPTLTLHVRCSLVLELDDVFSLRSNVLDFSNIASNVRAAEARRCSCRAAEVVALAVLKESYRAENINTARVAITALEIDYGAK